MRFLHLLLLAVALFSFQVNADVYMLFPRASNNRLDEASRDRNNGARLFDSQNNDRGGVNVGAQYKNSRDDPAVPKIYDTPYFYEGSKVTIAWTAQHSCGNPNADCQIIFQYMCDDDLRDGTTTSTIPENEDQCADKKISCDRDGRFGRHESNWYYKLCKYTSRNKGLFLADRQLNGVSARFTRQNDQGNRRGLECPEERDYYPYWRSTPWRDIAIVTNRLDRCAAYRAESQNVKSRWRCEVPIEYLDPRRNSEGFIPINKADCEKLVVGTQGSQLKARWIEDPAWNMPPPDCVLHPWSRDNHHGDVAGGFPATYNWTVPDSIIHEKCVLRIRYNITTGEFNHPVSGMNFGFASAASANASSSLNFNHNSQTPANTGNNNNINNQAVKPAEYPLWERFGLTAADVGGSFSGTIAQTYFNSRGYVMIGQDTNNQNTNPYYPQVDIFGSLLAIPNTTSSTTPQRRLQFQLAVNTAQFGRTFQDRSHMFAIRRRTPDITSAMQTGQQLWNIGVWGKRGNIVQVYPNVEYDFVPPRMVLKEGDLVHFQWQGSNTNPGNNAGQGPNGFDRSNVILATERQFDEPGQLANDGTVGQSGAAYPGRVDDEEKYPFLGFSFRDRQQLAMSGLNASYFDLGVRQVTRAGIYHYLSTRNNNFSNRNQQATIVVQKRTASEGDYAGYIGGEDKMVGKGVKVVAADYNEYGLGVPAKFYVRSWISDGKTYVDVKPRYFSPAIDDSTAQPKADAPWPMLEIDYGYKSALTETVVVWTANDTEAAEDEGFVLATMSGTNSRVSIPLQQGGTYVIKTEVVVTYVGAVIIGVLIGLGLLFGLYYKVRILPMGGMKAWWNHKKYQHHVDTNDVNLARA